MEVIKFHGTRHPVEAVGTRAEVEQMQMDAAVRVLSARTNIVNLDMVYVLYEFTDPIKAALDMELPVEILMEHSPALDWSPEDEN